MTGQVAPTIPPLGEGIITRDCARGDRSPGARGVDLCHQVIGRDAILYPAGERAEQHAFGHARAAAVGRIREDIVAVEALRRRDSSHRVEQPFRPQMASAAS